MRRPVFYITSTGYSGSTLLTLLLSAHPRVGTIGEQFYLSSRTSSDGADYCSCGKPLSGCEFLLEAQARGRKVLPDRLRDLRYSEYQFHGQPVLDTACRHALSQKTLYGWTLKWFPCEKIASSLHAANRAVIDYVLDQTGASIYLDASKEPINALLMSGSSLFDVTPIWLIRDGRAWFNSALRRHPGVSPEFAAKGFVRTVRRIRRILGRWPPHRIVSVKYEALCQDTEGVLDDLFSRMQLDPAEKWPDFRRSGRHIIGNASVVQARSGVVADACLWREQLSDSDLAVFEDIAGDVNRSLGYA